MFDKLRNKTKTKKFSDYSDINDVYNIRDNDGFKGAEEKRYRQIFTLRNPKKRQLLDHTCLRSASRYLVANDATAHGILEAFIQNVIHTGISPRAKLDFNRLGISEQDALIYEDIINYEFKQWAKVCDIAGRHNFYEIQELMFREFFTSGDVFLYPIIEKEELRLQVIDPIRVGSDFSYGINKEKGGIEYDKYGRPLLYRVTEDSYAEYLPSKEIPAKDMIAFGNYVFPDQARGLPMLTPVIHTLTDLDQFLDAELVAKKIAASLVMFIKKDNSLDIPEAVRERMVGTGSVAENFNERLEPATLFNLGEKEDVTIADPKASDTALEVYTNIVFRRIASSLGIPVEYVTRDITGISYSALRHASLEAQRAFRYYQQKLINQVLEKVYPRFIENLVLRGILPAKDFVAKKNLWCCCDWETPGWAWVDPSKEVKAAVESINNGLSTRQEELGKKGKNFEDVQRQLLAEERIIRERMKTIMEEFGEAPLQGKVDEAEKEEKEDDKSED